MDRPEDAENKCKHLNLALSNLVRFQLDEAGLLLTVGAISTLSPGIRCEVIAGYKHLSDRGTDIIIDGITEGSLRPVAPLTTATLPGLIVSAARPAAAPSASVV